MIENLLHVVPLSVMAMFLWFDTNVFYEYLSKIPVLRRMFRTYDRNKKHYDNCKYAEFLMIHHNNFWSKLVSCPYCLGFWVSLASTLSFSEIQFVPVNYLISLMSYMLYSSILTKINGS